jgi:hypothetical protein
MYKKIICILTVILVLVSIFMLRYNWTSKTYLGKKINSIGNMSKTNANENIDKQTSSKVSEDTLLPNNKIIYIVKDTKSKDILWQFEEKSEALVGKNRTQLEAKYGEWGYSVDFTNSEVTLEKDSTKYTPNKYVIGSNKEGFTVLYKTDISGNLIIEDKDRDIAYKKVQDMINSGAYSVLVSYVISGKEFNTRDEAESCLGEIK